MASSPEPLKVQIVGHVNSNYPDAWRTRQDYIDDQRQQRSLVRLQAVTLLIAILGLVVSSYFQFRSSKEKQTVIVEVVHKHVSEPSSSASSAATTKLLSPPSNRASSASAR